MVGWRSLGGNYGLNRVNRNSRRWLDSLLMKQIMRIFVYVMVCLGLFAVVKIANAASPTFQYRLTSTGALFTSQVSMCASWTAPDNDWLPPAVPQGTDPNSASAGCKGKNKNGNFYNLGDMSGTRVSRCADGTVPNASLPLAQQCPDPGPVCTPGKEATVTVSQGFKIPGTNNTSDMKAPSNVGGCRVYPGSIQECKSSSTGEVFCTWRVTEGGVAPAGESPAGPATMPPDVKPDKVPEHNPSQGQGCPKGTKSLGTDSTGQSICGGSGTSATPPAKEEVKQPPVTTNNPDGSTTKVDVTTRKNSDGSTTTTTKTTTTGADGKVTTKEEAVTGNKPGTGDTGKGKDDTSEEEKDDFCIKNPDLNACKNSEVTNGSCNGGTDSTSCTGDAIQCAILREQKRQYCEQNKDNDQATLANQVLSGNDPKTNDLPTKENATNINMQTLNQAGFLGGGSCFQDKTMSMMGQSVTLPFSKVCPYLEWLRYVVMLIAALVSFRIISKPVLGE